MDSSQTHSGPTDLALLKTPSVINAEKTLFHAWVNTDTDTSLPRRTDFENNGPKPDKTLRRYHEKCDEKSNSQLLITDFDFDDPDGCLFVDRNDECPSLSSRTTLNVAREPSVSLVGPATIVFGGKAIFHGRVNSETKISVSWQKGYGGNALKIDLSTRKYRGSSINKSRPQLHINNADPDDQAEYLLVVRNDAGIFHSNRIMLNLTKSKTISKDELNFARYIQLNQLSTASMKLQFDKIIPPTQLTSRITKYIESIRIHSNTDQKKLLFAGNSVKPNLSSRDFDVSVMYIIIRNTRVISQPVKGWGKTPRSCNKSIGDDIERLHMHHNKTSYRITKERRPAMSQGIFSKRWKDLSRAVLRISDGSLRADVSNIRERQLELFDLERILQDNYQRGPPVVKVIAGFQNRHLQCGGNAIFEGIIISTPKAIAGFWQKIEKGIAVEIDISAERYDGSSLNLDDPRLVISDLEPKDTGIYELVARNVFGVSKSNAVSINMEQVSTFQCG